MMKKWIALTLVLMLMTVPCAMACAELMDVLLPSVAGGFATMKEGAVNASVVRGAFVQADERGNRTYRFELADPIAYANGKTITAEDYVFAALILCSPELAAMGCDDGLNRFVGDARQHSSEPMSGVRLLGDRSFSLTIAPGLSLSDELARVAIAPCPIDEVAPGCEVRDDGRGAYLAAIPGSAAASVLWESPVPLSDGEQRDEAVVDLVYPASDWDQVPAQKEIQLVVSAVEQQHDEPVAVVKAAPVPVAQLATPKPQAEPAAQRVDVTADAVRIADGRCMMTLRATLVGFDGLDVSVQWQCDEGAGWRDVPQANGLAYEVEVTEENMHFDWRAIASING